MDQALKKGWNVTHTTEGTYEFTKKINKTQKRSLNWSRIKNAISFSMKKSAHSTSTSASPPPSTSAALSVLVPDSKNKIQTKEAKKRKKEKGGSGDINITLHS